MFSVSVKTLTLLHKTKKTSKHLLIEEGTKYKPYLPKIHGK